MKTGLPAQPVKSLMQLEPTCTVSPVSTFRTRYVYLRLLRTDLQCWHRPASKAERSTPDSSTPGAERMTKSAPSAVSTVSTAARNVQPL